MILNLATYVTILDSVKTTITTKDPKSVNLIVTLGAGFSSISWMVYALLIGDHFIFYPCFVGMNVFILNFTLYLWTIGKVIDSNYIIATLKWFYLHNDPKYQFKKLDTKEVPTASPE